MIFQATSAIFTSIQGLTNVFWYLHFSSKIENIKSINLYDCAKMRVSFPCQITNFNVYDEINNDYDIWATDNVTNCITQLLFFAVFITILVFKIMKLFEIFLPELNFFQYGMFTKTHEYCSSSSSPKIIYLYTYKNGGKDLIRWLDIYQLFH